MSSVINTSCEVHRDDIINPSKALYTLFLLCERLMIILHRGWAIKEWTLLFWTISARYLLNNPNNYENRGGPVLSAILWRTIPAKIHGFIFNFSTWILQLNSKFCTLPYLGKTFLHFSLTFDLNFFIWPCSVYIFNSRCQITQLNHAIFNSTNKFLFTSTIFSLATL